LKLEKKKKMFLFHSLSEKKKNKQIK